MTAPTTTPISDYVVSHLRTIVPLLYGHLAAWLVSLGVPATLLDDGRAWLVEVMAVVLTAAWYALWRWLEPHIPAWLRRLALGAAKQPSCARE